MSKRADYVPAEPVRRALVEWLRENGLAQGGWDSAKEHYYSPFETLSARTGIGVDAIQRHAWGDRGYENMQFDVADKLLCATERQSWWLCQPELSEVYEQAVRGADQIYPIVKTQEPLFSPICEWCEEEFEVRSQHVRKFCSQACRQAAYKERKVAA